MGIIWRALGFRPAWTYRANPFIAVKKPGSGGNRFLVKSNRKPDIMVHMDQKLEDHLFI
jgi:hypothetical protein